MDFSMRVLEAASPALLAVITWLSMRIALLINIRVRNEQAASVLSQVNATVSAAVRELQQTVVEELKAGRADGKLGPEERAQLKQAAIDVVKKHIGKDALNVLQCVTGCDTTVDSLLGSCVEAAVYDLRNPNRMSGGLGRSYQGTTGSGLAVVA